MENKNMTALVSCFVRAYHYKNNKYKVFSDSYAMKLLTEKEYNSISSNMVEGISFFNPGFKGTSEEALRWIVDNQLSPSVLARSAFTAKKLDNAKMLGCKQCLIYASGYDTSAYKQNSLMSFYEIDKEEMINDKIVRLKRGKIDFSKVNYIACDFTNKDWYKNILNSSYNKDKISFSSLLGISYYLSKNDFKNMINQISKIVCEGSSLVFDYPSYDEGIESKKNSQLAKGANEEMKSKYSYQDIENILSENGFLIYEHLNYQEMTDDFFNIYNTFNPNNKIKAPKGINYCLAVKNIK